MSFLEMLKTKYNAKFIAASPARVDFFSHALETDPKANREAAKDLLSGDHKLLRRIPEGDLVLCNDGIVFVKDDDSFPVKFFCAWKTLLVFKKPAVQPRMAWCDKESRKLRIDGKPLASYCLFDVLLPKYGIVLSADEHTPDGERLEKNQIRHASDQGIFVYCKDENNHVFDLEDPGVVFDHADMFWGHAPEHGKRLFIYSREKIL
jgi:hypothetical protein